MTQVENQQPGKPQLTAVQQIFCAWPLVLVFVGGAIGGACGGAAWAINTQIMSSKLSAPLRYILCVITGIVAAVVWYFAALALTPILASMFN